MDIKLFLCSFVNRGGKTEGGGRCRKTDIHLKQQR